MPPPLPPPAQRDLESESESEESEAAADEPSEECEDDRCNGPQPPIWHCVDCDSSYCADCWPRQGPHKPKKKGRDGVPHEKTNPFVVRRLKAILHPTRSPEEIQRLHEDDESTKWFGVARDLTGRPNFEDYGRYASLMASISPIESNTRYPQLVSFIGVTNAGKSTLIKMLINHDDESRNADDRAIFPSPVVGSIINDSVPTSGDVHLYADPSTHAEQLPILFADCEGFEGGERMPIASSIRRNKNAPYDERKDLASQTGVYSRPIEWANTEEQRQREFTVTALYPRLLYTFSDCVVFVLRNAKTFQSAVLTKLLDWGVASLEKSINQPALPHCVVALNGSDPSIDEKEWDIDYATQSLLSSVSTALDQVEGVPRFRELADYWRGLGKHIYTVEDLILRYYSSFKVVRIPAKPRYMTIDEQIGKLHGVIRANCEESFRTKRRARMLTNADELNVYLQSGFDHFTTHLNIPFNFMQISLLRNPIPNDFGGHILQLCTTISAQQPNHQPGRVAWLFEKLSVMLASCVLLDCARFRKGRVDELFGNYEKFFDYAMGEYLELHYPCSFVSADGSRQCMLVKARHQPKGHQDEKGIIAAGDYEAAFDSSFLTRWKSQLRAAIDGIQRDFQYELEQNGNDGDVQAVPEERIALDLHIEYLNQFFETIGPAGSILSHATCFCCLMDVPEHPLPCGHVLCSACIKAYGKPLKSAMTLNCCPLHRESTKWTKPALVKFKPNGAGVRILALDGGGIRGIVQLEVLKAIEHVLGGHINIQAFFDLIVGTGTGGMLGVALAMRDRTVDSCIDMFKAICDHAFQPRMKGIPVVSSIVAAFGSGRRYKTKPLYGALKTAFGDEDYLFGSVQSFKPGARVALTSTSATGRESILLASYRRPDDVMPAYQFERPHEPDMELKLWQSVAASVANPGYFRPFTFHGQTYLDGGLRSGNPAFIADRERRLIWPDVAEPDLFLSLGTGQNRITVLPKLTDKSPASNASTMLPQSGDENASGRKASGRWRARRLDEVLDAELAWMDFRQYAVREKGESKGRRFIRFNPDLDKEPPGPDSKGEIDSLQANVKKRLQTPHRIAALRNVAHRLVASSFYLDLQKKATAEKSEQICTGVISCRFDDGSAEMDALGLILEDRATEGFVPYFHIKPDADTTDHSFIMPITKEIVKGMTQKAVFGLPNIYIPLRDESKATSITLFLQPHDGLEPDGFPISGFPRVLLGEQQSQKPKRPTRQSLDQRIRDEQSLHSPSRASMQQHSRHATESDSISLNGAAADQRHSSSGASDETWQEMQGVGFSQRGGVPKMSLAEIIAQNQGYSGTSVKGRTNRFWTYIGNNHMAQHPEQYSNDELTRFASGTSGSNATEQPRRGSSPPAKYYSPRSSTTSLPHRPARQPSDSFPTSEPEALPALAYRPSPTDRTAKYSSLCETEFEEEAEYSGTEQTAQAERVTQVRVRSSPILYHHSSSSSQTLAAISEPPRSPPLLSAGPTSQPHPLKSHPPDPKPDLYVPKRESSLARNLQLQNRDSRPQHRDSAPTRDSSQARDPQVPQKRDSQKSQQRFSLFPRVEPEPGDRKSSGSLGAPPPPYMPRSPPLSPMKDHRLLKPPREVSWIRSSSSSGGSIIPEDKAIDTSNASPKPQKPDSPPDTPLATVSAASARFPRPPSHRYSKDTISSLIDKY